MYCCDESLNLFHLHAPPSQFDRFIINLWKSMKGFDPRTSESCMRITRFFFSSPLQTYVSVQKQRCYLIQASQPLTSSSNQRSHFHTNQHRFTFTQQLRLQTSVLSEMFFANLRFVWNVLCKPPFCLTYILQMRSCLTWANGRFENLSGRWW